MIICAGNNETFDFATPIGVGLIDSAINLTKFMIDNKPTSLTFIGSAGSYGKYKIFDIIESSVATNIENSYMRGDSYTPIENRIVSRETIDIVNSSNYITTNEDTAILYQKEGIELENMEFFSVLRVAKEFGIMANGIFIVTNYCNESAHEEFIKNHERAKQMLTQFVKQRGIDE